jgi:hypothetical protein
MIASLFINLGLCFKRNLFIVAYIFLFARIWALWFDRPVIMEDMEEKFNLLLFTDILLMTVFELFWILVVNLLSATLYVANNEASYLFRLVSMK